MIVAGTEIISRTEATDQETEDDKTSVQGESLLLPLLQELLDKRGGGALPLNRSASGHSSESSAGAAADSGTESGEEPRLLGLNAEPLGPGLISEVHSTLTRLASSLESAPEAEVDPAHRSAVLELVERLQASLTTPASRPPPDPRPASSRRFSRGTRTRQHRHTVGVSSEELAAARRLVEEVAVLRENISQEPTPTHDTPTQISDGNVDAEVHVPNTTPKPFMSLSNKPPTDMQSYKLVKSIQDGYNENKNEKSKEQYRKSFSLDSDQIQHEAADKEAAKKILTTYISLDSLHKITSPDEIDGNSDKASSVSQNSKSHESDNEDDSTLKVDNIKGSLPLSYTQHKEERPVFEHKIKFDPGVLPKNENNFPFNDARMTSNALDYPRNKYGSKKYKLKRANTIDIPKPAHVILQDEDSDSFVLDAEQTSKRNYLALRGPIRVNITPKANVVPSFEPKTENDKKFMAFIQKHNSNANVNSLWHKPEEKVVNSHGIPEQNWTRKFGNIKTIFESEQRRASSPMINSAKKFWQTAEKHQTIPESVPKEVRKPGKILQNFEQKESAPAKLPWTGDQNHVVTGSLRVESAPQTKAQDSNLVQGKNYKFIPQPLPVNKFSHAPMSAFKPPPKKLTIQTTQKAESDNLEAPSTPLYLYSPKHCSFPEPPQETQKPVPSTPWANQSEHRVLNIVASKFEQPAVKEERPVKEKLQHKSYHESFRIPHENDGYQKPHNKVRRMSGEYDSKTMKQKVDEAHEAKYHGKKLSDDQTNVFIQKENGNHKYTASIDKPEYHKPKPKYVEDNESKIKQKKYKKEAEYDHYNKIKEDMYPSHKKTNDNDAHSHNQNENNYYVPRNEPQKHIQENQHNYAENVSNHKIIDTYPKQDSVYTPQEQPTKPLTVYNNTKIVDYNNTPYGKHEYLLDNYYSTNKNNSNNSYSNQSYTPDSDLEVRSYQVNNSGQRYTPEHGLDDQVYRNSQNYQNIPMQQHIPYNSVPQNGGYEHPYFVSNQIYEKPQTGPSSQPYIHYENNVPSKSPVKEFVDTQPFYETRTYVAEDPEPEVFQQQYQEPKVAYNEYKQPSIYNQPQVIKDSFKKEPEMPYRPIEYDPRNASPLPNNQYTKFGASGVNDKTEYRAEVHSPNYPKTISPLPNKTEYTAEVHSPKHSESTSPLPNKCRPPEINDKPERKPEVHSPKKPPQILKIFDFSSPEQSPVPTIKTEEPSTPPLTEYKAVSKVMTGPVSQQAVTVSQNTPKRREEHDLASRNIQSILQRRSASTSPNPLAKDLPELPNRRSVSPRNPIKEETHQNNKVHFPKPPEIYINNKTITSESYEIENNGETVLSTKLQIPVNKAVSYSKKEEEKRVSPSLSKADSWIKPDQMNAKPSPLSSPRASPRHYGLQKAKSSHSLAVPKQFEAGMTRDEVELKKKTVQAYFGPTPTTKMSSNQPSKEGKRSSSKRFSKAKPNALSRSQTMPDVYGDLVDDMDDVDAEFENIFKASVCK